MARRRIAVITARAGAAEQWEILRGIAQTAFSADADVVVYSNLWQPGSAESWQALTAFSRTTGTT